MLFILLSLLVQSPKIELPEKLNAKPGRLIQITAKTEQKSVKWFFGVFRCGSNCDGINKERNIFSNDSRRLSTYCIYRRR